MHHLILPNKVDRVLCLGVDMIVMGDLHEFYDMDLTDVAIVASPNVNAYKHLVNDRRDKYPPINGEATLVNVQLFRDMKIKLSSYAELLNKYYTDEEMFPVFFKEKIKYVDTFVYNYRFDASHYYLKDNDLLEPMPKIIHYVWYKKPWFFYLDNEEDFGLFAKDLRNSSIYNKYMGYWWKYAKMCSNYNTLKNELHMIRTTLIVHSSVITKELVNNS